MRQEPFSNLCNELLFRCFPNSRSKRDGGAVVALASPQPRAGVSKIIHLLAQSLRDEGHEAVTVISAGELTCTDRSQGVQHDLIGTVQALRGSQQYVLIDCGSMKTSQNAVRLAPLVDGVVFVVEANKTQIQQLHYAQRMIESVNGCILGYVLNKRTYVVPKWCYRFMETVGV